MKKSIKGIIFDLDGTLLATDSDLCDAINQMRHDFNLDPLPSDDIKSYLGDGIRMLVTRSLPISHLDQLESALSLFHTYYGVCYNVKTVPYDNVLNTLIHLQSLGYRLSIVSNKAQGYVEQLVHYHFPRIQFDCVYGDSISHARKPHPQGILEALQSMNCEHDECILVGDSIVDIETAINSDISICPVSWGFQSAELLFAKSHITPINSIKDLLPFIESLRYN